MRLHLFLTSLFLGLTLSCPLWAQVDSVVVFNEIHYHPEPGAEEREFIELYNQNSVNVDLSGWTLEGAGTFAFASGTTIEGRSTLVLAKNPALFEDVNALGPFAGALANGGETLTLRNHNGRIMDRMDYRDSYPWPAGADGSGATLSKRQPFQSSGRPGHWAVSRDLGGTPGATNETGASMGALEKRIVISEVAALTESPFWIELANAGSVAVDLSQLHLFPGSGEAAPALSGTLAPGQFQQVMLEEGVPEEGLRWFLTDPTTGQFLDAAIVQERARARADLHPEGRFFVVENPTPGEANVVAFEDRIVINEIMYHHRPDFENPDDPEAVYRENDEEWIELTNRGDEVVDLSGWRLRDGIEFDFEAGVTLAPGAFLVVARDAEALAAKYPDIVIVGDYRGSLQNGDDRVELQDALGNPADAVHYFEDAPWPADADGGGSSLELRHPDMDNSVAEAWAASDESSKSEWHTYTYRAVAERPVYTAGVRNFHELRVGYIQAGRCLMDNVSIIEDPDGARMEIVRNRTFGSLFAPTTSSNWRLLGTHERSEAIMDPDAGAVLRIEAESSMNYLNNLCEASLTKEVEIGKEYEVSFDAKWLSGSPQLRTEVYYNKFAKKHVLIQPEKHGTPGAPNTALEENPGPTFRELSHDPAVPTPSEAVTVSVQATDPDGIDTLTLFYSVNEGEWETVPMSSEGERYEGVIPPQARNATVQFYVEGVDQAGGVAWYPAAGPESGAFVRVDNPLSEARRQTMRLSLSDSDSDLLHNQLLILSNARRQATMVLNEEEIIYNCGVRQRGSMFSRSGAGAGLNIKFPADQRFRGVQPSVIIRWRNPQEILVKHMANQAGDVPASYNDFLEYRGYRGGQTGLIRMEMARFGENYVKGAFEGGDSEGMFKMEGIRDFQQTGAGDIKRPMPIGWIVQFDLTDLGDDKEQYRHVLRMISAKSRDDYSPMVDMCKAFGAPDDTFREAIEAVLDVDEWCRMLAVQTLCGIADVYPIENPHNFNFYRRPTDHKIIAIPWDWDFTFNLSASSRIIDPRGSNKNLWRLLEEPGINRLFRGHLLDVIDTVFNEAYASTWFSHYAEVGGTNYNSHISYVRSRASNVKGQAGSQTPFLIVTNEGEDFSVEGPEVTLQGKGGVRVRTIEHVESGLWLEPHWIDDETWELTLPLTGEVNTLTLQARDYQGTRGSLFNPAGSDAITVTNTSAIDAPQAGKLWVSEIMYHPAEPSEAEREAGFDDQDQFEFIELINQGERAVDLRSLAFTAGVSFRFEDVEGASVLDPGEIGLVVSDRAAFEQRYGEGFRILGTYTGNLANGGERLTLVASNERLVFEVAYDDRLPWPEAADGEGDSLTLTEIVQGLDPGVSESWRASGVLGGTPGVIAAAPEGQTFEDWVNEVFSEEDRLDAEVSGFAADPDGDGYVNGIEFALGLDPKAKEGQVVEASIEEGKVALRYPQSIDAEAVLTVEVSSDLEAWTVLSGDRIVSEKRTPAAGNERVELSLDNDGALGFFRIVVSPVAGGE